MIELNLYRVDYLQVGMTVPKCLKLLPKVLKENTNKVVVADSTGTVHLFGVKKREIQTVFKSLPGLAATCLDLGGPIGMPCDNIFVSSGTVVRGFTRKGKMFLDFNSGASETIRSIYVEGTELLVCGNYIYHQYNDCKDVGYYLCSDQLSDVIALPTSQRQLTPILACKNRMLRILQDSKMLFEYDVSGPPETLCLNQNTGGAQGDEVLYGTSDGQIGLVKISSLAAEHLWHLSNEKQKGGILCLGNHDITNDGVSDLLVSRDDGSIEVYGFDDSGEPQQRFTHTCTESITSIDGGNIGSGNHVEVICSSYTGWVMGFTTEPQHRNTSTSLVNKAGSKSADASVATAAEASDVAAKILQLRQEIEEITERLAVEQEQYREVAADPSSTSISAVPFFNVNEKFTLNRKDASYTLCLEVGTPIDNLLVQSDVPVDLLDVDKNSAVVSFSACDAQDGNFLLATYRCQANTTRLELKIRTIEGQHGHLQVYITPKVKPLTCRVRQFQIKPLSMHQRCNHFDPDRPHNMLRLSGTFSLAEMHSWVSYCLPELPDRTPADDVVKFYFESAFLETQLECCYRRNEAVFRSENISAISILRDVLTKEATKKSIRLEVSCDVNDASIPHVLTLLHPKLNDQVQLARNILFIEALKDVEVHENGVESLTAMNKEILQNADQFIAEYKRQPCYLERLYGIVTDLYIDIFKFKGQNVKNSIPQMLSVLENYDYDSLLKFFLASET